MSIKIHHGPPGSYKTSGAVMDDFIPAAKAGRVVVTNVRGLSSRDKVEAVLGDLPDAFQLHYLPTTEHDDAAQNREHLARWWHWLPHGALLLIDEAQMIWPKAWKEKELKALDYPGGLEAANAENRPLDFLTAFDMHRHYGWDLVLTTPSISKIRPDIRGVAEGAFKHKNLATLGLKGRYIEAFHLAEDSGGSASDLLSVRSRKISKEVWQLYDSTATGQHSDTLAGSSLLKNPRIIVIFGVLVAALGYVLLAPWPSVLGGKRSVPPAAASAPGVVGLAAPLSPVAPGPVPGGAVVGVSTPAVAPLDGYRFRLYGEYSDSQSLQLFFEAQSPQGQVFRYRGRDLQSLGYEIGYLRKCLVTLRFNGQRTVVSCDPLPASPPAGSPLLAQR